MKKETVAAYSLQALIPWAKDELREQLLTRIWPIALLLTENGARAIAFSAMVPYLDADQIVQVHKITSQVEECESQAKLLAALTAYLSGEIRAQAIVQALNTGLAMFAQTNRSTLLEILAPNLDGDLLARAIDTIGHRQVDRYSAGVLALLTSQLSGTKRDKALKKTLIVALTQQDSAALKTLAIYLDEGQLAQILNAIPAIESQVKRAEMLSAIVPHLTGKVRDQALLQ